MDPLTIILLIIAVAILLVPVIFLLPVIVAIVLMTVIALGALVIFHCFILWEILSWPFKFIYRWYTES